MLTLIEKGMTREQAYDLVQPKTAQSWDNQVDFKPLLEADPEVTSRLTQEEIDEIFNPTYYTNGWMKSSNASVWVTNPQRKGNLKIDERGWAKLSSL